MLEIDWFRFFFKTKVIWFSEVPFDVKGFDGVSFYECIKEVNLEGFSKEEFTTLVIDLTQDLDTIWKKMHRSSCRRFIKKAEKDGVIIRINQGYDIFNNLNSEFRKIKGLPRYDLDIEFMPKNGILFLSEFQGKIICGHFYLCDDKNMFWLLCPSKRFQGTSEMKNFVSHANKLMVWEAIKYSKERGMSTFDLGGYYTGEKPDSELEGINRFKQSLGGLLVTRYNYQKDYGTIYSLARWINSKYFLLICGIYKNLRKR